MVTWPPKTRTRNLGAGADHLKAAEIEEEHEGRGVGAPERAVKRKGRQREGLAPALAGHHLKDVAPADMRLGPAHRVEIPRAGEVRFGLGLRPGRAARIQIAALARGLSVEVAARIHHPFGRLGIGGACRQARPGPGRADQRHLALHPVKDGNHRGAQQHRIGQTQRIGVAFGQPLDQPDHVVAEIAEQPGRRGRHVGGQVDPAFGEQRAQAVERWGRHRLEPVRVVPRCAVDPRRAAAAFPDHVGLQPDDRIAPTDLAAGDRFEQEGVALALRQFQHQRYRRVEIGRQPGPDQLIAARLVARAKALEIGFQRHGQRSCALTASTTCGSIRVSA